MSEKVAKLGGRKFILIFALTVTFLAFGVYCVHEKADLSDAAMFVGAVGATAYGYFRENVRQKLNGGT